MRAFAITGPSQGEVRHIPMPEPGPGEVVVRVAYTGICGTDYHIWKGDFVYTRFPLTNGHEFSGFVDRLGPGVSGWREGDRVAVDPTLVCMACDQCQKRQTNHCRSWGAIGDTTPGAMAEFVVAPARNLYRVEDHERLDLAAFTEPLACVVWGMERLRTVLPGSRAVIFGAGPIGSMWTHMLATSPAAEVAVVDVADEKLVVARTYGATSTFVAGPDLAEQLRERTGGFGFDILVDCTGVASVIEGMFAHAAPVARFLYFGVAAPSARISISPFDVYHRDWEIIGSMAINTTFQRARDHLAAGRIDVAPLLSQVGTLEDIVGILSRPKTVTELKTLIAPNGTA
jgi:threonine dehydrogenase-like Zn-dependent dehydrogenase